MRRLAHDLVADGIAVIPLVAMQDFGGREAVEQGIGCDARRPAVRRPMPKRKDVHLHQNLGSRESSSRFEDLLFEVGRW